MPAASLPHEIEASSDPVVQITGLDFTLVDPPSFAEIPTRDKVHSQVDFEVALENEGLDATGTPPTQFGSYELLEKIARGGMGVVYRARQLSVNRIVALKTILASRLASKHAVQRFQVEAETVGQLAHPGIVPVYESGHHHGVHYICMEFVDGVSLADRLDDEFLSPDEAARISKSISEAIAYAHSQGVIHRDLKPANILLDQSGQPRVTDFGLAKRLESDCDLTATGQVFGTATYMSPEQAAGKGNLAGTATDVYGLGAILYTLLTGQPPFRADTVAQTLAQVSVREPVAPRQIVPELPADLETICLKCLEKAPSKRYASAQDVADELQRFLERRPIQARPISSLERGVRWSKRRPVLASVSGLLVLSVVFGMIGVATQWYRAEQIAKQEHIARMDAGTQRRLAARRATKEAVVRSEAEAARALAVQSKRRSQRLLYIAHMNLVQNAIESGQWNRALTLLNRHVPIEGQTDLRGPEWYLWRQRCRGLLLAFSEPEHVTSVLFVNNDRDLIVGGCNTIRIRDAENGTAKRSLAVRNVVRTCMAVVPERQLLATNFHARKIAIWNLTDGKLIDTLEGRTDTVWSLDVSSDGKTLASASHDGTIRIWDIESRQTVKTLTGHTDGVLCVRFIPGTKQLVSTGNSQDRSTRVWNTHNGECTLTFRKEGMWFQAITFMSSPRWIQLVSQDGSLMQLDSNSGHVVQIRRRHSQPRLSHAIDSARRSPDGKFRAIGRADGSVELNPLNRSSHSWKAHPTHVTATAFSDDGQTVATVAYDGSVRTWSLPMLLEPTDQSWNVTGDGQLLRLLVLSDDTHRIAALVKPRSNMSQANPEVHVYDTASQQRLATLRWQDEGVLSIAFDAGNKKLLRGGDRGSVIAWSLASETIERRYRSRFQRVHAVAASPDGQHVAAAGWPAGIRIWNTETGAIEARLESQSAPHQIVWSPNSEYLACRKLDGSVDLIDVANRSTSSIVTTLARSVAFTPDGSHLAVLSHKKLELWRTDDRKVGRIIDAGGDSFSFSDDAQTVVISHRDQQSPDFFDVATGERKTNLRLKHAITSQPHFASDSNSLLYGSANLIRVLKMVESNR